MLEVVKFRSDFHTVRHKKHQTDLDIINNHIWIGVSWSETEYILNWYNCTISKLSFNTNCAQFAASSLL